VGVEIERLNVTHKAPYKRSEGKTNDLLIAFIGYVHYLKKLQQFKVSVKKTPPPTSVHFSTLLTIGHVALLTSSWRSCCRRAPNSTKQHQVTTAVTCYSESWVPVICFRLARSFDLYAPTSDSCVSTPTENWTHVYVNLFTRNSPYYHLLKYLLFLLKHPVCIYIRYYMAFFVAPTLCCDTLVALKVRL
jgi:hypothetical protein